MHKHLIKEYLLDMILSKIGKIIRARQGHGRVIKNGLIEFDQVI